MTQEGRATPMTAKQAHEASRPRPIFHYHRDQCSTWMVVACYCNTLYEGSVCPTCGRDALAALPCR